MQRKHMTQEEVMQAMREMSAQMKTPEGQKAMEEVEKRSKFHLKILGWDDMDYEEKMARERMGKEKR